MKSVTFSCVFYLVFNVVSCFWDEGTTTAYVPSKDLTPRQSFFRWQETQPAWKYYFYWGLDWDWLNYNRRLCTVAGISIDFLCLGSATILNRRTFLTSANYLDPYFNRQRDLRIWALGAYGEYNTPYRYRVWRVTRLFPKSLNVEHWHGPRGRHSPRHDVALIHSMDIVYLQLYVSTRGHYPYRAMIMGKHKTLTEDLWYTGSGYENRKHIRENYKLLITKTYKEDIVDCSKYLPKYWGKFICIKNRHNHAGLSNGGGLHTVIDGVDHITGIGCFEIRYNEEKIFAFTDLRYYNDWIFALAHLYPGEYYEYAYPEWGIKYGLIMDSGYYNYPVIPTWQIRTDFYPLG